MQAQNSVATAMSTETQRDDAHLVKVYKELFDVVPAETQALLEESYRLRYQVYCIETGFEDKDAFQNEMETDKYDDQSVSSLLIHKSSGSLAGTVRLILPSDKEGHHEIPALTISSELNELDETELPRGRTAEISRFSVSKKFRQRHYDTHIPGIEENAGEQNSQRVIPHITLGLMTAIVRMSVENGITHWAVVMEPALQRLLRKLGIRFKAIGPIIEYHGRRRTHYSDVEGLLNGIYEERPEIWNVITDCGTLYPYTGNK